MNSGMTYEIRCFHIQSHCPGAVDVFPHVSYHFRNHQAGDFTFVAITACHQYYAHPVSAGKGTREFLL